MSKLKDYLMDIEDHVCDAIERGARTEDEVYAYVRTYMTVVRRDVDGVTRSLMGEYDEKYDERSDHW